MGASINSVLILAGDTDGNLGDRAIVLSTCEELRRLEPAIRIALVSGSPGPDHRLFGAQTVPRGLRGLGALARTARRADLVLCGGGGLFQDDTSLVKMPYWGLRLLFVRCFARNVVGYSLGVGPLRWPSSRVAARVAFACMRRISVRDDLAREIADRLTSKPVGRCPDPALLLPPAPSEEARRTLEEAGVPLDGSPLVGVAVRRWFHHRTTLLPHKYAARLGLDRKRGRERCDKMVSLIAEALDRIEARHHTFNVFLPTYLVSHEADDELSVAVMRRMRSDRKVLLRITDPRLYKAVTGRLAVMLGGRMHPTILTAAMGRPVVGLSYNHKFRGFFRLLGQEDKVIHVGEFVRDGTAPRLEELLSQCLTTEDGPENAVQRAALETRRFTETVLSEGRPSRNSMNALESIGAYRRAMAAQWMSRDELRALQVKKLRKLVQEAHDQVPYYRRLFNAVGLEPGDVRCLEDLSRIPVTSKATLQALPTEELLRRDAPRGSLRRELSSGSTGRPFAVLYDDRTYRLRSALFLRGLRTAGYRLGQRVLMISSAKIARKSPGLPGWHYASFHEPPTRLLEYFLQVRPRILYGCVSPVRLLAEALARAGCPSPGLRSLVTTAETLDPRTRQRLEEVFRCPVFDFYGLSETGLVGWECREHRGYHIAEDAHIVEALPLGEGSRLHRLVITSLESSPMPFIRLDSGDTGILAGGDACSCGRTFSLLARVEGRVADCIRLESGALIAPYDLTCRLETLQGLRRYRVVQRDLLDFTVALEDAAGADPARDDAIQAVLRSILGAAVRVTIERRANLDPPPGQKYRVVESMLGREATLENPVHEL